MEVLKKVMQCKQKEHEAGYLRPDSLLPDAYCDRWTGQLNVSEHQYPHPENEGDFRTSQIELSERTDTVICIKP